MSVFLALVLSSCALHTDLVQSDMPSEKFIDVVGNVDESIGFKLRVEYRTTAQTPACTDYSIALGRRIVKTYTLDYYPQIIGLSHRTHIPLQQVSPNTECSWQPTGILICSAERGVEPTSCSSIFALNGQQKTAGPVTVECTLQGWCFEQTDVFNGAISVFNQTYVLHVFKKQT
ncbi:hypothetical protein [Aliiglaciecola sp. LCG003]|uniref:hypothetical protein n=1 Tax=Aliiglaciecola sp. LCG003 TaxID=3053655 RepID=UPI0025748D54|nr:hypothetical protein [Aliiglaciecola sp. LCG003]WJG10938.1 hypothetical protein QR722_07900 [Aliiglaciecola sp. LCG003]